MATIVGPQTITIGAETGLNFVKSWVPKYNNEIKKGNTTVKKATSTQGEAVLRISHQVTKGIEGHVVSLEIEGVRGAVPVRKLVKAQLVVTCVNGDPDEVALATSVAEALCTYIPTVIDDIFADLVD